MEEDGESSGSDEEAELVTLTRKKKDPTPVWECGAIKIEGGTQCTLCGKEFKCDNFNTSNIVRHRKQEAEKGQEYCRNGQVLGEEGREEKESEERQKI